MEKGLTIRTATEKDAAALLDIYRPYVERTAITFEYEVPTLEEFRQRICHTLEKYPYLVAEAAGEIVGYAYLSAFHPRAAYQWCAETSIYVNTDIGLCGISGAWERGMRRSWRPTGCIPWVILPGVPSESRKSIIMRNCCTGFPMEHRAISPMVYSLVFHRKAGRVL